VEKLLGGKAEKMFGSGRCTADFDLDKREKRFRASLISTARKTFRSAQLPQNNLTKRRLFFECQVARKNTLAVQWRNFFEQEAATLLVENLLLQR